MRHVGTHDSPPLAHAAPPGRSIQCAPSRHTPPCPQRALTAQRPAHPQTHSPPPTCAPQGRGHTDFLVRLQDALPSREGLLSSIEAAAAAEGFSLQPVGLEEAAAALGANYLRQNREVDVAAALALRAAEAAAAAAPAAAAAAAG